MARHPWVAEAANGIRFGLQLIVPGVPGALPRLMETGKRVEQLGYDALFILDHPAIHADPWVCLPGLAVATERIRLGSAVNCVPYRHPAHLARLAADLDNLSRGRFILGLGSGWLESEFRALDVPFGTIRDRQDRLDEAITIITGVWGPEPFSFEGKHVRTEAMQIHPPPLQQPRPPILIGGSGERRTLRQVAQHADACNVSEPRPEQDERGFADSANAVRQKLAALQAHCDDLGRPYDEVLKTHFTLNLMLGPNEQALAAKFDRVDTSASTSPGTRRSGKQAIRPFLPDQAVAYYQSLVAVGIQYFVIQLDGADLETIELLATDVMPRVNGSA